MRRAILIAFALITVLSLVPSGSSRGLANDADVYRWYRVSVHFSGQYENTYAARDQVLSTTWSARTPPSDLHFSPGHVSFNVGGSGTVQAAKLFNAVDMGSGQGPNGETLCPGALKTTRALAHAVPLKFQWFAGPGSTERPVPHVGFPLDSYRGHTEWHCSAGTVKDYVGPEENFCPNPSQSAFHGPECALRGVDDTFVAGFLKDEAVAHLFRVPSGRLGHDFSFRPSVVRSYKLPRGSRVDFRYAYTIKFHACPRGGRTKKRC